MASDAQKRANNAYHKENIRSLVCRVKKEDAEKFKDYAVKNKTTVNALLKKYVHDCINKDTHFKK